MPDKLNNRAKQAPLPGTEWRILAARDGGNLEVENQGILDEVVIHSWLHLEQLDERQWWMRLGDARILINVAPDGNVRVDIERGCYQEVNGETTSR